MLGVAESTDPSPGGGNPHDNDAEGGNAGDSNVGAIAGGAVGGMVGALLVAALVWYYLHRRRRSRRETLIKASSQDGYLKPELQAGPALSSTPRTSELDPSSIHNTASMSQTWNHELP